MPSLGDIAPILVNGPVDITTFEFMDMEDVKEAKLIGKPLGLASMAWCKCDTRIVNGVLRCFLQYLVSLN